jgi:hypothetical protein
VASLVLTSSEVETNSPCWYAIDWDRMKYLLNASPEEAKAHFLAGSSYFSGDLPEYISFEPILNGVAEILKGGHYNGFKKSRSDIFANVNYSFLANKDGRFAWRPYELIHPAIYVSLVNLICCPENWLQITARLSSFKKNKVVCCSSPIIPGDQQSQNAAQVRNWWQAVEQQSLVQSLEFSHILQTDVTNCYGSLYTHSIPWALHGREVAKKTRDRNLLVGNQIDAHIQASRYGQTNGISQGSVLMDFVAELVLGYVDTLISDNLKDQDDARILRYRDDYRIFANSDVQAESILKVVSENLRSVGMHLGTSKTFLSTSVVEGSIKPDKLAGIELQTLGNTNAKTLQKQLLRLHSFGRRFPNSGALRRLTGELYKKILKQQEAPDDLEVQVAIATDIAVVSPLTFPAIAGILSHLISLVSKAEKDECWNKVIKKMRRVPYNGYLEIWLQRVTKPGAVGIEFCSSEPICQIVNGKNTPLWENDWIASADLKAALDVSKILVRNASDSPEVIKPEEVELFTKAAWAY